MGALAGPWVSLTWLLLAALAIAGWLWSRRARARILTGPLRVLARLPLEPRRAVYVVRVAERVLVLGASEGGLCQLAELSGAEARHFELAAEESKGTQ